MRDNCVYIMTCGGFIKIGVAQDPISRMNSLQTGNPVKISLFGSVGFSTKAAAFKAEKLAHSILQERGHHCALEWYEGLPPEEALEIIRGLTDKTEKEAAEDEWVNAIKSIVKMANNRLGELTSRQSAVNTVLVAQGAGITLNAIAAISVSNNYQEALRVMTDISAEVENQTSGGDNGKSV